MQYERRVLTRNRVNLTLYAELKKVPGSVRSAEHSCIRGHNLVELLQSNSSQEMKSEGVQFL